MPKQSENCAPRALCRAWSFAAASGAPTSNLEDLRRDSKAILRFARLANAKQIRVTAGEMWSKARDLCPRAVPLHVPVPSLCRLAA